MSEAPTVQPFDVIPAETNPLFQVFGDACINIENYTYYFMDKMCGEAYQGGMWEFRKYPNGAICMVFPDTDTKIDPVTFNGNYVTCSLEAISYACWLIVLSQVGIELQQKNILPKARDAIHDQYHGLLDAISGRARFIITPGEGEGYRDMTPEDEDLIIPRLSKYPELSAIGAIID